MRYLGLKQLSGSPPRVRGKVSGYLPGVKAAGITPAGAGKRYFENTCFFDRQDHPRGCGEKFLTTAAVVDDPGSPPRVRGKVLVVQDQVWNRGITPAGAGKRLKNCGGRPFLEIESFNFV